MTTIDPILKRARGAVARRTIYELGAPPPDPDLDVWPEHIRGDCSGFIGWCCRLTRHPAALDRDELSTNTIYADAVGANRVFQAIDAPEVGGFVIYPYYKFDPADREHAGHIAIITHIRSRDDYDIVDCASSSYAETGDAIREHRQEAFTAHAHAALAARVAHPDLPERLTRPTIFARCVSCS